MTDPVDLLKQQAAGRVGALLRGKYTLERLLGVGGMSAVYRAVHRNGNRVAVKMLHPKISEDRDVLRRFLQEGYAANNVDHPGVVSVLDDDTAEDGSAFVVMELLEGSTLGQQADRNGGILPPREVMTAAHQLLDVLAAAREKGIIHRDIKPENIFLTNGGALKLLDFGLARIKDGPSFAGGSTIDGTVFGTPAFMPPEQALGDKAEVDHQSDIWAVGATMFTLLTGKYVHEAATPAQQLLFTASRPAPSLATAAPHMPPQIVAIVDKALRFSKSERWESARAMQQAVEEAFTVLYHGPPPPRRASREAARAGEAEASSQMSMAPTLKWDPRQRVRPLIVAIIAAGVILLGLIVALGLKGGGDPPPSGADTAATSLTAAPQTAVTVTPTATASAPVTATATATVTATVTATATAATSAGPSVKPTGGKRKPRSTGSGPFDHQ